MALLTKLTRTESNKLYKEVLESKDTDALRRLCKEDLFFLISIACKRPDLNRDWIYDRCREVEESPDGYLDLWSREHYKSTIITFGLTIREILNNPDATIGIFSHTRPIAKSFLAQIKRELETNTFLQNLFPEVLYANPQKDSPKWSLDDGIIVRRSANPKESTVEAWGLVDGQPTSKHYSVLNYDDVVTKESVSTPEMIKKVTDSWALSLNLASQDCKKRYIGTRYHANDTYKTIMDRKAAKPRLYPATKDGTVNGEPVLMTKAQLVEKRESMGSYIFASQMLQNPLADKAMGFKEEWLEYYDLLRETKGWNFYITVDSASEKKKTSDYTVMMVFGLAADGNYYLVDGYRDRVNLTERTNKLFELVRKWNPKNVGYERYGLNSDIEHIKYVQQDKNYRFRITELGGQTPKNDRIRKLVPLFENRRIWLPRSIRYKTAEGNIEDLISQFINNEYLAFPVSSHDDMLDCMARILDEDLGAMFPKKVENLPLYMPVKEDSYNPLKFNIKQNPTLAQYKPI